MPPECQLFGTLGCHLCEVAEAVLMPFVEHGLLVELVDIADDEAWVEHYGLRIPVLRRCDNGAELNWPFEAEQVAASSAADAYSFALSAAPLVTPRSMRKPDCVPLPSPMPRGAWLRRCWRSDA